MTTDNEGGQLDLFGTPTTVPAPRSPAAVEHAGETNDVDLIRHIAGNATRGVYLLVGASERVYARTDGADSPDVVRVPRYEEHAVHQLLRRGWLARGGAHHVTCGAARLTGTAVLAPRATRARVARWDALARPATWRADTAPGRR